MSKYELHIDEHVAAEASSSTLLALLATLSPKLNKTLPALLVLPNLQLCLLQMKRLERMQQEPIFKWLSGGMLWMQTHHLCSQLPMGGKTLVQTV